MKNRMKSIMAFVMAFLTLMGIMPVHVLAQTNALPPAVPTREYVYFDGERLYLDDERIYNIIDVSSDSGRNLRFPLFSRFNFTPFNSQPTVTRVFALSGDFARQPDVYMNNRRVSALRYAIEIDGILYEGFCADPQLPGPEASGAAYELTGPAAARYRTVLRYGFPTNPYFSQHPHAEDEDRLRWNAYITRVAVAMANNPNHTFTGNAYALSQAEELVGGSPFWVRNFDQTSPAIMVNGVRWATDANTNVDASVSTVQSTNFTVSYNRRNSNDQNRFRFVWASGTPAGAQLVVNGSVIATAPANSNEVFWEDVNFRIQMPNNATTRGQEARVYLVGIHNAYANRVWLMQNSTNRDQWQDIVFYIPYMRASAAFSFESVESEGNLRIVKRNPAGQGLAGAVFQITGPDGFNVTRTTSSNGVVLLEGLQPGVYTVTEITPPPGHLLADPVTQTVTIQSGSTAVMEVVFINPPIVPPTPTPSPTPTPPPREPMTADFPSVRIQKVNALTRENIPGALMRIEGRSSFQLVTEDGQIWEIDNTGIDMSIVLTAGHTLPVVPEPSEDGRPPVSFELEDGVLTIHNLPWGYYRVQEERAPDGFSLLPQHTAYSFWVLPPNVLISVAEGGSEDFDGAFEQGAFSDGSMEAMFYAILNNNLGGPAYTLADDFPASEAEGGGVEFIIDEEENVNSILILFENYPFSEVVVEKLCRETNRPLADAIFRIEGFFVEGNAPQVINMTGRTGADGRYTFRGLPAGGFTVSEVSAPPGFLLDEPSFQHVNVSWGQTAGHATRPAPVLTFLNTPMAYLEVIKVDGENLSARLDGAVFRLTGPDQHGNTVILYSTTVGGTARFEPLLPHATYILEEVSPPAGFVLMEGTQTIVTTTGRNEVTWRNWRNPGLTIIKRCQDTGAYLAGAVFTMEALGTGSPLPTDLELVTDASGRIFIPWTLFEGEAERSFRVTEIVAPHGFHLGSPNWQIVTLIAGYDNTVVFQNRRMPTITIQKRDSVTGAPIENAEFTIERLTEPNRGMLTGNPFRTDANGQIVLPFQYAGMYRIVETRPALNFWLDPLEQNRSWIIEVRANEDYLLVVENTLLPSLVITKWNALTHRPVPLTHFRVEFEQPNSGNVIHIGNFITNQNGQIILPFVQSGWYRVTETRPAPGMALNTNNNYRVFLAPGQNTYQLMQQGLIPSLFMGDTDDVAVYIAPPEIPERTEPLPPTNISPDDEVTTQSNPSDNSNAPTNSDDATDFDDADINIYDIEIVEDPALVARLTGGMTVAGGGSFTDGYGVWNFPLNSIVIKKSNITNGRMLAGATFDLIHVSTGESGTRGTVVGTFTTDHSGIIVITGLEPGAYVVEEVIPPPNFMLALNNRQHVFLRPDGFSIVETHFSNYPYGSLLVTLRCEVTGQPIQNAEFRVTNSNGAVVGTANGLFRTNQQGYFLIPNLRPDSYVVVQTLAPYGFVLGSVAVPQTIHVRPDGQTHRLEFTNQPLSTLIIRKIDSYDNSPIAGARYRVYRQDNSFVGEFITDNQGLIEIPRLLGWFTVREIEVPMGFKFDPQTVRTVQVQSHAPALVTFYSPRLGSLTIEAVDEQGTPLTGATFRVSRQNGANVGTFTTGVSGVVNIPNLTSGWYFVEAITAPAGFIIGEAGRSVEVLANTAPLTRFVFPRLPALVIEKVDTDGNPLAGATFEVRTLAGLLIERVVTNQGGVAIIYNLAPGSYEIRETIAPQGFALVEGSRAVEIMAGQTVTERFVNPRLATLVIQKVDGVTNAPLQNVVFEVSTLAGDRLPNHLNNSFEFVTDAAGMIRLPNLPAGTWVITETRPLPGFITADPVVFAVGVDREYVITVRNYRYPDYNILKLDGHTGLPLAGVQFEIAHFFANGQIGGRIRNPFDGSFTWTTDASGMIRIPNLEHGTFIAIETRPLPGFRLAEPRVFVVADNEPTTITIHNYRYGEWNIHKLDGHTNRPQAGVVFEVARFHGSGTSGERMRNPVTGSFEFITDTAGIARIGALTPGTYIITETRPLPGFVAAEPVIITVGERDTNTTVTIRNYREANLTIRKVNSITRAPLEGVIFEISRPDGTRLINPQTGFHDFVTDRNGLIHLPVIEDGRFYLRETRALPGFLIDEEIIPFNIDASARVRDHVLTVENTPAAGLLVSVTDAQTRRPLEGIEIEVRHADGRIVTGQMLHGNQPSTPANSPQLSANGNFLTDIRGRVNLNHLTPGVYHVRVLNTARGSQADTDIHVVTVVAGQQALLEISIIPLAGLRLHHFDAVTNAPIFNAEFMLFDRRNQVVGNFTTDNRGMIDFPAMLASGRYTIRLTRPAPGYSRDDMPRTVEFVAGRVTEIRWEAIPIAGQLQIQVVAGVNNEQNALPMGTPLAGAIFEIFSERTGNLVDRIITNQRGMAVSRPLPLGRYYAVQVAAPTHYMINPQTIPFEVEFASQIVRFTFPNFPANTGVTINLQGQREVMQGHSIFYDIRTIRNDSTIPLGDFYWRAILPTHAVRADRLITGTFNHSLRYTITARTNRGHDIVVADNLMSTRNNVIELRPVHLGLAADEYLVELTISFGQVPAGFTAVERPRLHVDVLSERQAFLPDGMEFAMKVDTGGRVPGTDEWVVGNDTWASKIFNPRRLPQSGF